MHIETGNSVKTTIKSFVNKCPISIALASTLTIFTPKKAFSFLTCTISEYDSNHDKGNHCINEVFFLKIFQKGGWLVSGKMQIGV